MRNRKGILVMAAAAVAMALAGMKECPAQSTYKDQYLMPDPQVWSVMKYGGQMPDLYTGTVRAEIPVYVYRDQDFEIPVSLVYTSNGYMPNTQANFVGLGWSLNAGGCVTRRVRGVPDNGSLRVSLGDHTGPYDVYGFQKYVHDSRRQAGDIMSRPSRYVGAYRYAVGGDVYETESDIYMFSFLGHSGKFVLRDDGSVAVYDTSGPSGEYSVDVSGLSRRGFPRAGLTVRDGRGYTYEFGRINESLFNNYESSLYRIPGGDAVYDVGSSWPLRRITAPNGRTVEFSYEVDVNRKSENVRPFMDNEDWVDMDQSEGLLHWNIANSADSYYLKESRIVTRLTGITIDGACRIDFGYSERLKEKYTYDLATGDKLSSILVTDTVQGRGSVLASCQLDYRYTSPSGNPVLLLKDVHIDGTGTYSMSYAHEDDAFPYHGCTAIDHWGYYNSNPSTSLSSLVPDVSIDGDYRERVIGTGRDPDPEKSSYGMLVRMSYPTGGWTEYEYEPHRYARAVVRDLTHGGMPYLEDCVQDMVAGGLRLRSVTDHAGDSVSTVRTYLYKNADGSDSGIMLDFPRYSECVTLLGQNRYRTGFSHSMNLPSYVMDATHIGYSTVTELFADGSDVTSTFTDYSQYPDIRGSSAQTDVAVLFQDIPVGMSQIVYPDPSGLVFREPQSMNILRGRLSGRIYRGSDGKVLRKEEISYDPSPSDTVHVSQSVLSTFGYSYVHNTFIDDPHMSSVTAADYEHLPGGDSVFRTTVISYAYNALSQKTMETMTDEYGSLHRKSTFYLNEVPSASRTPAESAMWTSGVTSYPLYEVESLTDGSGSWLVSSRHSVFTDTGGIFRVSSEEEAEVGPRQPYSGGLPSSLSYRPLYTFGSFDAHGRPTTFTDANGIHSLMIWGYGGLYPVALVENAYPNSLTGTGITFGTILPGALSASQEASLRGIAGASVTTWKYRPSVGVTEKTGPDGRKTSYGYDAYGRLISVTGPDSETISEYIYSPELAETSYSHEN